MRRTRRAFTLIELLVVIAIIALLVGILLPALGQARNTARAIVAGSMAKQLALGVHLYANENDGFIPGLTTSTTAFSIKAVRSGVEVEKLAGMDSEAPVQGWDWMMPAVGVAEVMPTNRIHRLATILDRYASPAMDVRFPAWDGGVIDDETLDALDALGGVRGTSWLQPGGLIWWGATAHRVEGERYQVRYGSASRRIIFPSALGASNNQVRIRPDYRPTLENMPSPHIKALFADGFRYWHRNDGPNVEVRFGGTNPIYQSFGTSSPIYGDSTAYGANQPGSRLSYRYGGRINVAFADGSVRLISEDESHNPELWYPSGSTFVGGTGTVEGAFRFYKPGDRLN